MLEDKEVGSWFHFSPLDEPLKCRTFFTTKFNPTENTTLDARDPLNPRGEYYSP